MDVIHIRGEAINRSLAEQCQRLDAEVRQLRQRAADLERALAAQQAAHQELQQAYRDLGRTFLPPDDVAYVDELTSMARQPWRGKVN